MWCNLHQICKNSIKLLSISIKKGPEGFLRDEQRHDLGIYRQTTQIRTCC